MRARAVSITALSLLLILTCALTNPGCSKPAAAKLRMGVFYGEQSAAIAVAEEEGYFADNGLDVTLTRYESGAAAVRALLAGEEDVATATDYVFASTAFENPNLRLLATIDAFDSTWFITRKSGGISRTAELKGRTVGTVKGTSAEYYLMTSLGREGMNPDDIAVVGLEPSGVNEALQSGDVDALAIWEPLAYEASDALGDDVFKWSAQGLGESHWLLITTEEVLREQPQMPVRLMSSMIEAEEFIDNHPAAAMRAVSERFGLSGDYLEYAWPKSVFEVSISSCLLHALDTQGRWYESSGGAGDRAIPNYRELVYTGGLETADPDTVRVVR